MNTNDLNDLENLLNEKRHNLDFKLRSKISELIGSYRYESSKNEDLTNKLEKEQERANTFRKSIPEFFKYYHISESFITDLKVRSSSLSSFLEKEHLALLDGFIVDFELSQEENLKNYMNTYKSAILKKYDISEEILASSVPSEYVWIFVISGILVAIFGGHFLWAVLSTIVVSIIISGILKSALHTKFKFIQKKAEKKFLELYDNYSNKLQKNIGSYTQKQYKAEERLRQLETHLKNYTTEINTRSDARSKAKHSDTIKKRFKKVNEQIEIHTRIIKLLKGKISDLYTQKANHDLAIKLRQLNETKEQDPISLVGLEDDKEDDLEFERIVDRVAKFEADEDDSDELTLKQIIKLEQKWNSQYGE